MSAKVSRAMSRLVWLGLVAWGLLWWLSPETKTGLLLVSWRNAGLLILIAVQAEFVAWVCWTLWVRVIWKLLLAWALVAWLQASGMPELLLLESNGLFYDALATPLLAIALHKVLLPLVGFFSNLPAAK